MRSKKLLFLSFALTYKSGESIVFKFSSIPDSSKVLWKVAPEEGVTLKAVGSTAYVLFSVAGSYTINATFANVVANLNVLVIDNVYNPAENSILFSATGHHIEI